MVFCPKCGNEVKDGSSSCEKCGAKIGAAQASKKESSVKDSESVDAAKKNESVLAKNVEKGTTGNKSAASAKSSNKTDGAQKGSNKTKLIVVAVIAVVVVIAIVVAAISLSASKGGEDESSAEEVASSASSEVTPESSSEAEEAAAEVQGLQGEVPQTCFIVESGNSDSPYELVNLEGNRVELSNPDAQVVGAFSEGYALARWNTSEYDEEWDTEHDKQTHFGLVDATGNISVDLASMLKDAGVGGNLDTSSGSDSRFMDGRMIVHLEPITTNEGIGEEGYAVIDKQGKLQYMLGRGSGNLSGNPRELFFHDGVLALQGSGFDCLIDVDGKVLVTEDKAGYAPISVGKGYYRTDVDHQKVYKYDGSVAFDAKSANTGDITEAELSFSQPNGGGFISIDAKIKNPYGGQDKSLTGIYSIDGGKWIVPLQEGDIEFSTPFDGLIWIRSQESVSYGASSSDQVEATSESGISDASSALGSSNSDSTSDTTIEKSKIVDANGNVVFDSSMADLSMGVGESFDVEYLHDGYWYVSNNGSNGSIVYIADGQFKGIKTVDFEPFPDLPNVAR